MKQPASVVADIRLDRDSPTPLHAQIAAPIEDAIRSGRIVPGARLEDEVSMAERLRVSRPTARRALETLVQRGLIVRRRGAGTIVTPAQVHRALKLTSLFDDLSRFGAQPRTSVLEWEPSTATPAVAATLGVEEGASVVRIRRLRMIESEPLAIMSNWIPIEFCPTREELAERGLYDLLRDRRVVAAVGVQQISARTATAEEGRLLNEPTGAALLTMQRTAYDSENRPIEFGQHVYRASMYSYRQTLFA